MTKIEQFKFLLDKWESGSDIEKIGQELIDLVEMQHEALKYATSALKTDGNDPLDLVVQAFEEWNKP